MVCLMEGEEVSSIFLRLGVKKKNEDIREKGENRKVAMEETVVVTESVERGSEFKFIRVSFIKKEINFDEEEQ